MPQRFTRFAVGFAMLWYFHATPCFSRESAEEADGVVWTAIIPDAFPRNVYTWRMKSDGTYREDGRDVLKGATIQEAMSGRWTIEGARMILRQEGQPFAFDGMVIGGTYSGTLYFNGGAISRFCAAKGDKAPDACSTGTKVAMTATWVHARYRSTIYGGL